MAPPRRPKHPKGPKHLEENDAELWRRVTETVTPLKVGSSGAGSRKLAQVPKSAQDDSHQSAKKLKPKKQAPAGTKRPSKSVLSPAPAPKMGTPRVGAPQVGSPPPLAAIDRKLTRRVDRGSRAVDAKLDLHGMTQHEAHDRLLSFLHGASDRGHRLILVVTGKGRSNHEGDWWEESNRGVLRRAVPQWLSTPPFRALVVGYESAHISKGGDGAIYVQIRRSSRGGSGH